jgi:uncharacterized protein YciI
MHYLLLYDVVPDYVTRRQPLRVAHLTYAQPFVQRGDLLLGGALADPVDQAVLLFQGQAPTVAEEFARGDPYVQAGLVVRWRVRPWITVAGPLAASPLAPGDVKQPGA